MKTEKINFTTDLSKISLLQVMEIYKILDNKELSPFSMQIAVLAIWTNLHIDKIARVEVKQIQELFNKIVEIISDDKGGEFERLIKIDGKEYGFIPDIEGMNGAEFMDIDAYSEEGFNSFHKMLSILYRPVISKSIGLYNIQSYEDEKEKSKDKRADLFLRSMNYKNAKGAIFFFLDFSLQLERSWNESQEQ